MMIDDSWLSRWMHSFSAHPSNHARKKKKQPLTYDKEKMKPILRKSICTGEVTAGFRGIEDRTFHEVMLIRNENDLDTFMEMYGITQIPDTEY